MQETSIAYLTHTWNPLAMKCTRVSPACDYCWHLAMANRLAHNPNISPVARAAYAGETGPLLIESRLGEPLKRKKPAIIGVQFMGDIFHENVKDEHIARIWQAMFYAKQHTFLVLTKRPGRMLNFVSHLATDTRDGKPQFFHTVKPHPALRFIADNIWLGVTVENQATADERRADFEAVPAAVKFVSYEPALEPIDWSGWEFVDWFISGGETGPGARPSHPDCHRVTRDFCIENDKSYFFKQHGEWKNIDYIDGMTPPRLGGSYAVAFNKSVEYLGIERYATKQLSELPEAQLTRRIGNKRAGNLLDGVEWQQMPGGDE